MTIEECWALVDTSEATGIPCMMLENWSFRRDNLAVLNMIRRGLPFRMRERNHRMNERVTENYERFAATGEFKRQMPLRVTMRFESLQAPDDLHPCLQALGLAFNRLDPPPDVKDGKLDLGVVLLHIADRLKCDAVFAFGAAIEDQ